MRYSFVFFRGDKEEGGFGGAKKKRQKAKVGKQRQKKRREDEIEEKEKKERDRKSERERVWPRLADDLRESNDSQPFAMLALVLVVLPLLSVGRSVNLSAMQDCRICRIFPSHLTASS
jgi:hypothetical protein